MNPTVRKMTAEDLEQVAELEQRSFSDSWSKHLLEDMLNSELDEAWVLEEEPGTVAAYANFRFLSGEGELMRIAVLPEFRGRG